MFNRTQARWPLQLEEYQPDKQNPFQLQAAFNQERNKLVLYVYNDTPDSKNASFDMSILHQKFRMYSYTQLFSSDVLVVRTIKEPNEINRKRDSGNLAESNQYKIEVPPFSFTEIILE